MLQFYFLSILFNLVTGLLLVNRKDSVSEEKAIVPAENASDEVADSGTKKSVEEASAGKASSNGKASKENAAKNSRRKQLKAEIQNTSLFESKTFRLVLGILTGLTGILKLVSVIRSDVPVIGDLLPALAGLAGCFCLILEYYMNTTTIENTLPVLLDKIFIKNSNVIGFLCIVIALLHFVFPTVLFL